ncbi:MAG: RluA family pseudouridine synthase [Myxococcales bacterium]|nr:RluA family pseudouridine synthase [Myxococcales bacterium]
MAAFPDSGASELALVRPPGIPEDAILRVVRVPAEAEGMRLDVFMAGQLRNTSRTRARSIVDNTAYSPAGKKLKHNDRVRAEDRVVLWRLPFEELDEPAPLPVVYEDEHLLVIDKPPLMAVHPTARHHHGTVMKQLEKTRPGEFFSLIHRIDRETSGLLLVAKTRASDRAFKKQLEDRSVAVSKGRAELDVEKDYLAITWGVPEAGFVELPLEPDTDNPLRVKMRVARQGGLEARTEVMLLDSVAGYALSRCRLHTGRQHQIRVHLAVTGTPIVGDKLYGPDERMLARAADGELTEADLRALELPRHALHAHRYRLTHAITGAQLELESPLAADLAAFWQSRAAAT